MSTPERTCLGCGAKREKRSLTRLAVNEQGQAVLDEPQRAKGRGAYVCGPGCLSTAIKRKALQRAFRGAVTALDAEALLAALAARSGSAVDGRLEK